MDFYKNRYFILLLAWLGWVFDIADTAIFNFAKGPMLIQMIGAAQYKLTGPAIEAKIQSGFLLGWSIGGLIFSILADRWGRTRTLLLTVLLYCAFTGLTALCHTPDQVLVARFITALGIGGEWAAGASLVAEAFADKDRPFAASVLQSAAAFGPVFAALANMALVHSDWRSLFLIGIAPASICVFARAGAHDPVPVSKSGNSPIGDLFRSKVYRRRAFASIGVGAVGIAGAGTASFWQPNLVRAVSEGLSPAELASRTSTVAMVSQIGTLAGVFIAPWLCRTVGRRKTIGLFFLLTPVALYLTLGGAGSYVRLLTLLPLVNLFAVGVSGAFVLYFPELFPARFRATGAGLAYNVGRVFSIPIPRLTAGLIAQFGGTVATGVMLTGSIYVIGLLALPFLPETMGRPLEEDSNPARSQDFTPNQ